MTVGTTGRRSGSIYESAANNSAEARQLLGPDTPTLRLYEVESSNHRFGGARDKVIEDVDDALLWIVESRRVAAR